MAKNQYSWSAELKLGRRMMKDEILVLIRKRLLIAPPKIREELEEIMRQVKAIE